MSVRPSVRRSVGPSVCWSVPCYFQTRSRRILCRVSGLVLQYLPSLHFNFQNLQNTDVTLRLSLCRSQIWNARRLLPSIVSRPPSDLLPPRAPFLPVSSWQIYECVTADRHRENLSHRLKMRLVLLICHNLLSTSASSASSDASVLRSMLVDGKGGDAKGKNHLSLTCELYVSKCSSLFFMA